MSRVTSFLALSAMVVAGAFAGTAAQASASNINVVFKVHNGDPAASMIRVSSPGTGMSGLISPAAGIAPGGDDPSTGSALVSLGDPNVGGFVQSSVSYANASDGVSNLCTFTITITRIALASYVLHFAVAPSTPCSVPANQTNTNGQFTSQTYALTWRT